MFASNNYFSRSLTEEEQKKPLLPKYHDDECGPDSEFGDEWKEYRAGDSNSDMKKKDVVAHNDFSYTITLNLLQLVAAAVVQIGVLALAFYGLSKLFCCKNRQAQPEPAAGLPEQEGLFANDSEEFRRGTQAINRDAALEREGFLNFPKSY